jgi:hypothetical protein
MNPALHICGYGFFLSDEITGKDWPDGPFLSTILQLVLRKPGFFQKGDKKSLTKATLRIII